MTNRALAVVVLAACSSTAPRPMANAVAKDPPKPPAIAVQLALRGTFMVGPPFTAIPPFTLLDDGTWIGTDDDDDRTKPVSTAKLSHPEAEAIRTHILELGFERLESHTSSCRDSGKGTSICVSDASYVILRVALPDGHLREITNYAGFSNEPEIYQKVTDYLQHYPHPKGAAPYRPKRAALHVHATTAPVPPKCPAIDLGSLHGDASRDRWAVMLDGQALASVLAIAPTNRGKFVACAGAKQFQLTLVPEVPGADLSEELGVYERK